MHQAYSACRVGQQGVVQQQPLEPLSGDAAATHSAAVALILSTVLGPSAAGAAAASASGAAAVAPAAAAVGSSGPLVLSRRCFSMAASLCPPSLMAAEGHTASQPCLACKRHGRTALTTAATLQGVLEGPRRGRQRRSSLRGHLRVWQRVLHSLAWQGCFSCGFECRCCHRRSGRSCWRVSSWSCSCCIRRHRGTVVPRDTVVDATDTKYARSCTRQDPLRSWHLCYKDVAARLDCCLRCQAIQMIQQVGYR